MRHAFVTLDALALSNMCENAALVELLERKGILTKQEVLAMIQELRRTTPMPPQRTRPVTLSSP